MSFRPAVNAEAERARASYVTRGFFRALGVTMASGRAFEQRRPGCRRAAGQPVLSYALGSGFAGDSAVLGRHDARSPITP
jgi:hypothetical protein